MLELNELAKGAGYASYPELLYDFYVARHYSLHECGARLGINWMRVRRHLERFEIPVRKRGGPNNVKVVLTEQLVGEIMRDGLAAVALRLGVSYSVLYSRVRALGRP